MKQSYSSRVYKMYDGILFRLCKKCGMFKIAKGNFTFRKNGKYDSYCSACRNELSRFRYSKIKDQVHAGRKKLVRATVEYDAMVKLAGTMKCEGCGSVLPATSEYFVVNRCYPNHLMDMCRQCGNDRDRRARYWANKQLGYLEEKGL